MPKRVEYRLSEAGLKVHPFMKEIAEFVEKRGRELGLTSRQAWEAAMMAYAKYGDKE